MGFFRFNVWLVVVCFFFFMRENVVMLMEVLV